MDDTPGGNTASSSLPSPVEAPGGYVADVRRGRDGRGVGEPVAPRPGEKVPLLAPPGVVEHRRKVLRGRHRGQQVQGGGGGGGSGGGRGRLGGKMRETKLRHCPDCAELQTLQTPGEKNMFDSVLTFFLPGGDVLGLLIIHVLSCPSSSSFLDPEEIIAVGLAISSLDFHAATAGWWLVDGWDEQLQFMTCVLSVCVSAAACCLLPSLLSPSPF